MIEGTTRSVCMDEKIDDAGPRNQLRHLSDTIDTTEGRCVQVITTEPQVSSFTSSVQPTKPSNPMRRAHSPTEIVLLPPDDIQPPYFTEIVTDQHARKFLRDHKITSRQ